MSNLLKISEATSMALHAAALLAREPGLVLTTAEAASTLGVSEAHLSKVLQRLAKAGLVQSVRGPRGGFTLAGRGGDTTLLEVYEAIEGPLKPTNCLLARPVCGGACIMGGLLAKVNEMVMRQLAQTKVSEVTKLVAGGCDA